MVELWSGMRCAAPPSPRRFSACLCSFKFWWGLWLLQNFHITKVFTIIQAPSYIGSPLNSTNKLPQAPSTFWTTIYQPKLHLSDEIWPSIDNSLHYHPPTWSLENNLLQESTSLQLCLQTDTDFQSRSYVYIQLHSSYFPVAVLIQCTISKDQRLIINHLASLHEAVHCAVHYEPNLEPRDLQIRKLDHLYSIFGSPQFWSGFPWARRQGHPSARISQKSPLCHMPTKINSTNLGLQII